MRSASCNFPPKYVKGGFSASPIPLPFLAAALGRTQLAPQPLVLPHQPPTDLSLIPQLGYFRIPGLQGLADDHHHVVDSQPVDQVPPLKGPADGGCVREGGHAASGYVFSHSAPPVAAVPGPGAQPHGGRRRGEGARVPRRRSGGSCGTAMTVALLLVGLDSLRCDAARPADLD